MPYRNYCKIQLDPKDFLHSTGITFEGLTISEGPEGWRMIIRRRGPRGLACYAIRNLDDLWDGPQEMLQALERDGNRNMWLADKFRK